MGKKYDVNTTINSNVFNDMKSDIARKEIGKIKIF